jgi:hypothetical protein
MRGQRIRIEEKKNKNKNQKQKTKDTINDVFKSGQ